MNDMINNISDNEIRVIQSISTGSRESQEPATGGNSGGRGKFPKWLQILLAIAGIVMLLAVIVAGIGRCSAPALNPETSADSTSKESEIIVQIDTLSNVTEEKTYTIVSTDTINDVRLRIIIPQGGVPELCIGTPDTISAILFAQAADVRGDNGMISGAFILQGELVSKGLPKLGFCSIIGNEITLGRQSETPLFERAIEENGYFFRQYALVSDGQMIDIKPKGKALRRALCYYDSRIAIIESTERESYHDFAQALADYGVKEAIALVGGDAIMRYTTKDGKSHTEGTALNKKYENMNYIVWK